MQGDLPEFTEDVAVLSCVKDLGELVRYNRSISLGHIKEKIEEGIHRIQRIEWLPCDLHRKALFIQTSVQPKVTLPLMPRKHTIPVLGGN